MIFKKYGPKDPWGPAGTPWGPIGTPWGTNGPHWIPWAFFGSHRDPQATPSGAKGGEKYVVFW